MGINSKIILNNISDILKNGLTGSNSTGLLGGIGSIAGSLLGSSLLRRGATSLLGSVGRGVLGSIGGGLLGGIGGTALGMLGSEGINSISPWIKNTAMPWLNNIGQNVSQGVTNLIANAKNWLEDLYNEAGPQAAKEVQNLALKAAKEVKIGKPGQATLELVLITKDPKIAEGMIQQMILDTNGIINQAKTSLIPLNIGLNIPTLPNFALNVLAPQTAITLPTLPDISNVPILRIPTQPNFGLNISNPFNI